MSEAATLQQTASHQADRSTFSYGWVMVGVAAVAMVVTLPGRTHGLGMITERLLNDPLLGLTRSGYGQLNLWATLLGSLFCIGIGTMIDRYGVRSALAAVMFSLGSVVVAMSHTTSITWLFIAILLTRGLGQSALSVVSIAIVGKWFDRRVSMPMAIYSILMAGGFIAAALIGREYANINWRTFWGALGWIVIGLAAVLTLLVRERTHLTEESDESHTSPDQDLSFTHGQALVTPMFWVGALGISLYGLIASGISLFNESILVDQGFAKEVYYESLAMGTAVGVLAQLAAGFLGIYITVNRLLAAALLLLAASLLWLTQLSSYADVVIYVTLKGVAGGMLTVLFFSTWSQLYGHTHLGKIQGSAQMLTVIASAFGPLLFAQTREWSGSYSPLLWFLASIVLIIAFVAWWTPQPRHPSTPSSGTQQ